MGFRLTEKFRGRNDAHKPTNYGYLTFISCVKKILNGSYTNFAVCVLKCVHTVGFLVLSPYIHFTVAMGVSMPSQNVTTHWQDKRAHFIRAVTNECLTCHIIQKILKESPLTCSNY
jgi:hypothetical protein